VPAVIASGDDMLLERGPRELGKGSETWARQGPYIEILYTHPVSDMAYI